MKNNKLIQIINEEINKKYDALNTIAANMNIVWKAQMMLIQAIHPMGGVKLSDEDKFNIERGINVLNKKIEEDYYNIYQPYKIYIDIVRTFSFDKTTPRVWDKYNDIINDPKFYQNEWGDPIKYVFFSIDPKEFFRSGSFLKKLSPMDEHIVDMRGHISLGFKIASKYNNNLDETKSMRASDKATMIRFSHIEGTPDNWEFKSDAGKVRDINGKINIDTINNAKNIDPVDRSIFLKNFEHDPDKYQKVKDMLDNNLLIISPELSDDTIQTINDMLLVNQLADDYKNSKKISNEDVIDYMNLLSR